MTIHKEGYASIAISAILLGLINLIAFMTLRDELPWLCWVLLIVTFGLWLFIVSFFRIPNRALTYHQNQLISPADGKVVVIEKVTDPEYFHGERLQISVFMNPANVHVNRFPIDGKVVYSTYHKGKYLVAWDPKSSTENERHSIVIKSGDKEVLVKQIAGALAKRIVNYCKVGDEAKQNEELGFIKFGSRVDLLLPPDAKVLVSLQDKVKGGVTPLASW
jgi:phosphatidylserine decarboxylase